MHTENARRVADQPGACPEACLGEAGAEGQTYAVSQQLSESFLDGQPQEQNSQGACVYGMRVGICACVSVCEREREVRESLCVRVDGGRVSLKKTLFKAYACVCRHACVCVGMSQCVSVCVKESEVRENLCVCVCVCVNICLYPKKRGR